MSHLMNLWDYRQALYAEAAKWVAGDVGKPGMTSWNRRHTCRYDAVLSRVGKRGSGLPPPEGTLCHPGLGMLAEPGSYAGIGYRISLPDNRNKRGGRWW
jgi:hypothetical protein